MLIVLVISFQACDSDSTKKKDPTVAYHLVLEDGNEYDKIELDLYPLDEIVIPEVSKKRNF